MKQGPNIIQSFAFALELTVKIMSNNAPDEFLYFNNSCLLQFYGPGYQDIG